MLPQLPGNDISNAQVRTGRVDYSIIKRGRRRRRGVSVFSGAVGDTAAAGFQAAVDESAE